MQTVIVACASSFDASFATRYTTAELAKDRPEVLMMLNVNEPPEVLILDLEITLIEGLGLVEMLYEGVPPVPVVVHAFLGEHTNQPALRRLLP